MWLLDVYAKLNQAEEDIQTGKTMDAREALKSLRAMHHV
jgi:hypothetical protein